MAAPPHRHEDAPTESRDRRYSIAPPCWEVRRQSRPLLRPRGSPIFHRPAMLGELLAITLWTACDPKISPQLLTSSRIAARRSDFSTYTDPLHDTITCLLGLLEEQIEADTAAKFIMSIFSTAEPADRLTVAGIPTHASGTLCVVIPRRRFWVSLTAILRRSGGTILSRLAP